MKWLLPLLLSLLLCIDTSAIAQTKPSGQAVLNQAVAGNKLSVNTNFQDTRGIYIGDVGVCDLVVQFANSGTSVTLHNLQPGLAYPFQIRRINSSGSTCADVIGLY